MEIDYHKYLGAVSIAVLITLTLSCSGRSGKMKETSFNPAPVVSEEVSLKLIKVVSPQENEGFKLHQPVKVVMSPEDNKSVPDSVALYFDGKYVASVKSNPWEYSIPTLFTVKTGRKSLKVTAFKGGKPQNTITRFLTIYSDIVPKRYSYKVIHTYVHSRDAFTQGLLYDNGVLFEGTGQETGSTLREVELETGKVIRQHNLDDSLFGEGIALFHDRLYQVTWKNKVGFVYDKSDFQLVNKIFYPTEGWGLTTINDRIVMSDGTDILYFYEPEMFTAVSRIEVYDNKAKVDSLNELEYIDGEIWANIWMSDRIARIDPASGKVLGYIDLKGILNDPQTDTKENVLNGIAFDKGQNRIFVTGKNWPKLFEIRITE